MKKNKIVFLCHFSNSSIRSKLYLKDYCITNRLLKFFNKKTKQYDDFAIWVSDYIKEFEKHSEYEFHVVAPHKGMKKSSQSFEISGICYHFIKCDGSYIIDFFKSHFRYEEKNNYSRNRRKIYSFLNSISPDLIILCGAENPYYSASVLGINDIPIYVITQTLLNDEKRIDMGIGTDYRRQKEIEVFKHAHFFCTSAEKTIKRIKEVNVNAIFLPAGFPTHRPVVTIPEKKDFDFVFFARNVSKNKGIEDLLYAFAVVKKKYQYVQLNIIGGCNTDYKKKLDRDIEQLEINKNVHFSGYFEQISDVYNCIAKARAVVVPGITAVLNSTVREAMFIGLPTICYETPATIVINKERRSLITVPMCDVKALAKQMLFTIEQHEKVADIAKNGKEYAENFFSNEAIVNKLLANCQKIIEKYIKDEEKSYSKRDS